MSPLGVVLLRLLKSSITIEITTYLFSRELEVDLSRSDVDDRVGGVEEWSSQDDGGLFFFYSYVQDHEISRNIAILNLYNDVLRYSLWEPN